MKPPMPWMGGKQALTETLCALFPPEFTKYVEVFGGGGALLFHKPPEGHHEVYNDKNHLLVNLFRCIREHPHELIDELTFTLNAREDFVHNRLKLKEVFEIPDIKMAAKYYQTVLQSYAAGVTSFGGAPRGLWSRFPAVLSACARLQSVVVENKDFEKLILQHDSENTFFYLDPPYYKTEDYYENVGFDKHDHVRLYELLMSNKGKWLLSYNDCEYIRDLYSKTGLMIYATERINNIALRYAKGKKYGELIIGNYDLLERNNSTKQLTLFGEAENKWISERNVIYNGRV